MIKLRDLLKLFPSYQLVALADEHGAQLPYGYRNKIIDLNNIYDDIEVLNARIGIGSDVLYIRIKV